MSSQTTMFALGVLVLLLALSVPAAIAVTESPARASYDLVEDETQIVTQTLEVTLENAQTPEATISLRDAKTLDTETQTISEGNESTYTINGESVNVSVIDVEQNSAQVSILYPRTYGWHDSAALFVDNLPFILVTAFGVVVLGMVGAAMP